MTVKYTPAYLKKLEELIQHSKYVIRYERGNFQSGWCLLEDKKVVVLNKFLNVEAKVNTLLEIIPQIEIVFDKLTLEGQKMYGEIMAQKDSVITPTDTIIPS